MLLGDCDAWTPNTASALIWPCSHMFVHMPSRTPTFLPEHHIRWFVHSTIVCAHLCELPQSCFVADQVFRFIDALSAFVPKTWAWTSTCVELVPPESFIMHDDLESQLQIVAHLLTTIAWALHQERACLTLPLNRDHDHGPGDDRGRPILPGPDPSMWRTLPQKIQDRSLLRWSSSDWPGAVQTQLECIGLDISFLWQAGRFVEDDCKIDLASRRPDQRTQPGSIVPDLCSMWPWQLDASDAGMFSLWNLGKQAGEVTTSLRSTLFHEMVKTLVDRVGKLKLEQSDDDLIQQLVARGVLTVDRRWNYLAWDPKALTLKPTNREPINSQEMAQILQRLLALSQNQMLVHRFAALRPLRQDSLPQDAAVAIPWKLDIALRTPEANELWIHIQRLSGNGITQLALLRIRQAGLQRSPLAAAISTKLRR